MMNLQIGAAKGPVQEGVVLAHDCGPAVPLFQVGAGCGAHTQHVIFRNLQFRILK
jgi:hypothetical protein